MIFSDLLCLYYVCVFFGSRESNDAVCKMQTLLLKLFGQLSEFYHRNIEKELAFRKKCN